MKAFVIGGTGKIGSRVAAGLASKGADVKVLTRDEQKAAQLPAGQTGVVGDLLAVSVLREEIAKADAVFMMFPPLDAQCLAGLTALEVIKENAPAHTVMMTGQDCRVHCAASHVGSMLPAEYVLEASELSYTLLNPNYFFQNDERQKDNLLTRKIYGSPLGDIGLSRCDAGDIADAAVAAFGRIGTRERVRVCGPDILTGEGIAAVWSQALGEAISYGGHSDMAKFERGMVAAGMPAYWALDLRVFYESIQRYGLVATPEDVDRITALLGRAPRSYAEYVSDTAKRWGYHQPVL